MAYKLLDLDTSLPRIWAKILEALALKQNVLKAGTGISISEDGTVSVTIDHTLFKFVEVLPSKPDSEDENKIFIILSDSVSTEQNMYDEYYWTGSVWEKLGSFHTDIDLADYYKKSEVDNLLSNKQDTLIQGANITISGNTISATDTTYSNATTSAAGLMSASDKATLDSISGAVTSVSASGTSPLTLTGSISGNALTLTGTVNSYTKAEIDEMIESATSGGITTVNASGSGELTLSASKSGTTVNITGSVDLSKCATTDQITSLGTDISSINSEIDDIKQNETDLTSLVNGKQDKLTQGDGITISSANVISNDYVFSIATTAEIDAICVL